MLTDNLLKYLTLAAADVAIWLRRSVKPLGLNIICEETKLEITGGHDADRFNRDQDNA